MFWPNGLLILLFPNVPFMCPHHCCAPPSAYAICWLPCQASCCNIRPICWSVSLSNGHCTVAHPGACLLPHHATGDLARNPPQALRFYCCGRRKQFWRAAAAPAASKDSAEAMHDCGRPTQLPVLAAPQRHDSWRDVHLIVQCHQHNSLQTFPFLCYAQPSCDAATYHPDDLQ